MTLDPSPKVDLPVIGLCIHCRGPVQVPAEATVESMVRCPHCQQTYGLMAFIERSIPTLELVAAEESNDLPRVDQIQIELAKDSSGRFVVPSQLSEGARRRRRRRTVEVPNEDDPPELGDLDERSDVEPRTRVRARTQSTSSPVVELIKIVLGGAMAIPIAYLLMFWVFRQDPLNLGPKLGPYVPVLVPAEFRGDDEDDLAWRPTVVRRINDRS